MADIYGVGQVIGAGITAGTSAAAAAKNRRFQKHMYRNRYRYTMSDMRKAGLNPILAASLGGGSSPPGATAVVPDFGKAFEGAATSAKKGEEKKLLEATRALTVEQTGVASAQAAKIRAETSIIGPQALLYETGIQEIMIPVLNRFLEFLDGGKAGANSAADSKAANERAKRREKQAEKPKYERRNIID